MVSLKDVQLSNSRIAPSSSRGRLRRCHQRDRRGVAEEVRQVCLPTLYLFCRPFLRIGRPNFSRVQDTELEGRIYIIQADVSLIHTVDKVCEEIKSKKRRLISCLSAQGLCRKKVCLPLF